MSQAAKKGKTPDAQLTPAQLRKRADNRRYRAATKARKLAAAGKLVPPSKSPEKQREYQARYAAKRAAEKTNGSGHSGPQEMTFPLDLIPDRVPSSLRERAAPRAHAASIGGFDANKLLVLELARLFNRILDGH